MFLEADEGVLMGVIPFSREHGQPGLSGVRIAYVGDRWCVETLVDGAIIRRNIMPSLPAAERVAARISRRDKVALLPPHLRLGADVLPGGRPGPGGTAA